MRRRPMFYAAVTIATAAWVITALGCFVTVGMFTTPQYWPMGFIGLVLAVAFTVGAVAATVVAVREARR